MLLSSPYALSGTDIVYAAIGLRACYAMSGTDLASRGTGTAYADARAMRCPVLTYGVWRGARKKGKRTKAFYPSLMTRRRR
eukprot:3940275-Rhodomonas_salina.1